MLHQLLIAAFVLFFISETIRSERRRLYGNSTVIMEVDQIIFPGLNNGTRIYSPITLSKEWSTLARLTTMVCAACFGATMNGYFLSSFVVEPRLQRYHNVFLCALGFADMMITGGVIPMATVVLLSGVWDIYPVCQFLQALTAASTYSYSILFAMVAVENYFRVVHLIEVHDHCKEIALAISAVLVFPFSMVLAVYGTFWHLDYDYCGRRFFGDPLFRYGTSILIHGTCFMITMSGLICCLIQIQRENRLPVIYRLIHQRPGNLPNMVRLNFFSYILYLAAWTPYLIVVNLYPNIADGVYYKFTWLGIGRSLITSLFYGCLSPVFGDAYSNIFLYCYCKTSLYNFYPTRARRLLERYNRRRTPRTAEVRTHIMQQAVNLNSPQRASSSTRETLEL